MKYIVINFRGGGKIKLPANILKSIDVPDDFTVNKEGENTNKRICIANGCYVDSLDKNIDLEQQLPGKKCYTSDDFSNNQLVDDDEYEFLEEILNSYIHSNPILYFSTNNGIIGEEFGLRGDEATLIPIGYKEGEEGEEVEQVIAYAYSGEELNVGTEVYGDENGTTPASGEYILYNVVDIEVPDGVYGFTVENGQVSELLAYEGGGGEEEEEGGEE